MFSGQPDNLEVPSDKSDNGLIPSYRLLLVADSQYKRYPLSDNLPLPYYIVLSLPE